MSEIKLFTPQDRAFLDKLDARMARHDHGYMLRRLGALLVEGLVWSAPYTQAERLMFRNTADPQFPPTPDE